MEFKCQKNQAIPYELKDDLPFIFNCMYNFIIKINLLQNEAVFLYPLNEINKNQKIKWNKYISSNKFISNTSISTENLSCEKLLEKFKLWKNKHVNICCTYNNSVKIFFNQIDNNIYAYIIHIKSDDDLFKKIADFYIYNNHCCYIFIDTKNNNYTILTGNDNSTSFGCKHGKDYNSQILNYAQNFVVPEDREMIIHEASISNVIAQLNKKGFHTFYAGVLDPIMGYTRKKFEYRYCDNENKTIFLFFTDVTEMYYKDLEQGSLLRSALEKAYTDSLTGLLNYGGIIDKVTEKLSGVSYPAAMFFIDMDNFKLVNDTYGHFEGDRLLKATAKTLTENIGKNSLAARIGGDEFVAFIWNIKTKDEAIKRAHKIRKNMEECLKSYRTSSPLSLSIGISFCPDDGNDYFSLVKTADKRLYMAKFSGKNRVFFD